MTLAKVLSVSFLAVVNSGCVALGLRPDTSYQPHIDPADFQTVVDNPYYPLVPGTILKYIEQSEGETLENEITVTHDTKIVMGVKCVVVTTRSGRTDWPRRRVTADHGNATDSVASGVSSQRIPSRSS
jgi:hypothetical protein